MVLQLGHQYSQPKFYLELSTQHSKRASEVRRLSRLTPWAVRKLYLSDTCRRSCGSRVQSEQGLD